MGGSREGAAKLFSGWTLLSVGKNFLDALGCGRIFLDFLLLTWMLD